MCFVFFVFVFPNGKPYIIMMKLYLISVSVSDMSFSQAGSELRGGDFISGFCVAASNEAIFNVPATSGNV